MPLQGINPLITNAPSGRHFAQLHRDEESLAAAVAAFVSAGLRRREGVVLVASAERTERILRNLEAMGIDPMAAAKAGSLAVLDARASLSRFTKDGEPSWLEFRAFVLSTFDGLGSRRKRLRVYGEMVDVLWHEGRYDAAIRLEEFWNRLALERPFALFCCYLIDSLTDHAYEGPLHEIGRTHTDVLATTDDDRLHAAVDAASSDMFGSPLSTLVSCSGHEDHDGEHRLPLGQRTLLWIKHHMPGSSATVLARVRSHYLHHGSKEGTGVGTGAGAGAAKQP